MSEAKVGQRIESRLRFTMRHKVYAVTDDRGHKARSRPRKDLAFLSVSVSLFFLDRDSYRNRQMPTAAAHKMLCPFIVKHKNKLRGDFH